MDNGHLPRSDSFGHDITPDERLHLVSQENTVGPERPTGRQVQVLTDVSTSGDGHFEVAYENASVSRQHFFEPVDGSPPDPYRFNVTNRYFSEQNRLKTFYGQWLDLYPVRPGDLARDGFIYVGPGDRVKCVFCLKTLSEWENGDNVEREHRRHYPSYPFVKGLCEHQNIPISTGQAMKRSMGVKVKIPDVTVPEMAFMGDRLKTFETWQFSATVEPKRLAEAGLFFTGQRDVVKCFTCGKQLRNWEPGDDPFKEHQKFYPQCPFVKRMSTRLVSQELQDRPADSKPMAAVEGNRPATHSPSRNDDSSLPGKPEEQHITQASSETYSSLSEPELLKTSAVLAVLQTTKITEDQLIPILQSLRLEKGPDAIISAEDILNRFDQLDGKTLNSNGLFGQENGRWSNEFFNST